LAKAKWYIISASTIIAGDLAGTKREENFSACASDWNSACDMLYNSGRYPLKPGAIEEKLVKRSNINVSEVSYHVAVGKPEAALLATEPVAANKKAPSELTVYNQDLALVKDVRSMNLQMGVNEVQFKEIASGIDATSVRFTDPDHPETSVLEQSYEYDLE